MPPNIIKVQQHGEVEYKDGVKTLAHWPRGMSTKTSGAENLSVNTPRQNGQASVPYFLYFRPYKNLGKLAQDGRNSPFAGEGTK